MCMCLCKCVCMRGIMCLGMCVYVRLCECACVYMCACMCSCACVRERLCVTHVSKCKTYLKSCSCSHPFAWKSSIAMSMAGPCIWFMTLCADGAKYPIVNVSPSTHGATVAPTITMTSISLISLVHSWNSCDSRHHRNKFVSCSLLIARSSLSRTLIDEMFCLPHSFRILK